MSERKVLNKYYPPDFDPSKIPRRRGPKNKQQVVRLMAPFSMRCNTCGEYVYKGKKFNARKETVEGEDYYGIKIFRFYIKCPLCSAEITFKTDPKNTDYVAEHGAARNYESWREEVDLDDEEDKLAKMEEEENNPMKALETRTLDSKREMDIMDALQDVRARNARHERLVKGLAGDPDALLKRLELEEVDSEEEEERERKRREDEEDERIVQEVFSKVPLEGGEGSKTIKRKADGDAPDLASLLTRTTAVAVKPPTAVAPPPAKKLKTGATVNSLGIKIVKKKKVAA